MKMRLGHDMDGCGNYMKYSLFVVNLILFIGGLIVVAGASWVVVDQSFANEILGTNLYAGSAYTLLITGFLVTFISCVGCYGSLKELRCLLVTYFFALFLIFVTMSIGAVLGYVFREKVETTLQNSMYSSLRFYGRSYFVTQAWDETQTRLQCCGVYGHADWKTDLPDSCCKLVGGKQQTCRIVQVQNSFTIYERGCLGVTKELVKQHAFIIGTAGIILSCVMILGMVLSCALFIMIK